MVVAPLPPAGPWRRYLARITDLGLFGAALGLGFYALLAWAGIPLGVPATGRDLLEDLLSLLGFLTLSMFAIALVCALAGTSPGKWLFGIAVRPREGRGGLSFHPRREFAVWADGLWYGFPVLTLWPQLVQYRRLRRGWPASYDLARARVVRVPPSRAGRIGRAAAVIAVLAALGALAALGGRGFDALAAGRRWTNPETALSVPILKSWSVAENRDERARVFRFTSPYVPAAVSFAYERLPVLYGTESYAAAVRRNLVREAEVEGDWQAATVGGLPVLRLYGRDGRGWRLQVTALALGRRGWLAVIAYPAAAAPPDPAAALVETLFSTAR